MKENYKIKVCVDRYNHVVYLIPIKVPRSVLSTYFKEYSNLPRHKTSTYELDQGPTGKAVGDQKKQYLYIGIFPENNLNCKKAPTTKYLRDLERKISLAPCCTNLMEEDDLNDLSEDYIVRLYDIIVDLDILIDNSKQIIEKDLCAVLREILWKGQE